MSMLFNKSHPINSILRHLAASCVRRSFTKELLEKISMVESMWIQSNVGMYFIEKAKSIFNDFQFSKHWLICANET